MEEGGGRLFEIIAVGGGVYWRISDTTIDLLGSKLEVYATRLQGDIPDLLSNLPNSFNGSFAQLINKLQRQTFYIDSLPYCLLVLQKSGSFCY